MNALPPSIVSPFVVGLGLLVSPASVAQEIFVETFELDPPCESWSDVAGGETCNGIDDDCDSKVDEDLDRCLTVPYFGAPSPASHLEDLVAERARIDAYLLLDLSGSMATEINAIRNNIVTVADNVTCAPLGGGADGSCIPDIWWGAGTIGFIGSGGKAYENRLDSQPSPAALATALTGLSEPPGCCDEAILLATSSTVTGLGSASSGCTIATPYLSRATCNGSPAGSETVGYPCFRSDSTPVLLVATDEAPTATFNCPTIPTVTANANGIGAKIVGIKGLAAIDTQLILDLNALALGAGAIDSMGNPLVFDGSDSAAPSALEAALLDLAMETPLDLTIELTDDPSDAVQAINAFVDSVATLQLGTPECADGLSEIDTNGDGDADTFLGITPGTPVCWQVVLKQNEAIPSGPVPQVYPTTLRILADGTTESISRQLTFVVPAALPLSRPTERSGNHLRSHQP